MKKVFFLLIISVFLTSALCQKTILEKTLSKKFDPEEVITLSESIPFNNAISIISDISEKHTGKKVTSTISKEDPIGIHINNMYWKKALLIITQYHNLKFDERETVLVISDITDNTKDLDASTYASVDTREVKISAVFFEANITEFHERGINWEAVFTGKGVTFGNKLLTFAEEQEQSDSESSNNQAAAAELTLNAETNFNIGDFSGTALTAFRFFETENLGDVIAKPSVTVRDRTEGKIQIGSNISIKQRDFSGNVVETFIPTGTIVRVTPYIYNESGVDYVLLKLHAEKSSAQVDALSTEIKKTAADTEVLLLNGEETIIGGLFQNEESSSRRGIPILKDLPWWFFGIRYLTGYESETVIKKEIIILIKAQIVPTLKERVAMKKKQKETNLINEKYEQDKESIKNYKIHKFNEEK